ncbi:MAG: hypothetical protein SFX74_10350 [Fimbriimonadaceae bacterium]|nr:hypothetical protein [Fimbriimonadaceae bacterium]
MPTSIALLTVLATALADPKYCVKLGDNYYIAGPSQRIASLGAATFEFSGSGKHVFYSEKSSVGSYVLERAFATGQRSEPNADAAYRWNVETGVRDTLYRAGPEETILDVKPIGPAGDGLVKVATGQEKGGDINDTQLIWKLVYCPSGQSPRAVLTDVVARSLNIGTSETERVAAVVVCERDRAARLAIIGPSGTRVENLDLVAQQGFFLSGFTADGNGVFQLQAPKTYAPLLFGEVNFRTGEYRTLTSLPELSPRDSIINPLFEFNQELRAPSIPAENQSGILSLVLTPAKGQRGRGSILLSDCVTVARLASPTGRAFIYSTSEGTFLREILATSGAVRARLVPLFKD